MSTATHCWKCNLAHKDIQELFHPWRAAGADIDLMLWKWLDKNKFFLWTYVNVIDYCISTNSKKMSVRAFNVLLLVGSILATQFCCSRPPSVNGKLFQHFMMLLKQLKSALRYQACHKCSMPPHKSPYQHLNPKSYPLKLLPNLKLLLQHTQNPSLSSNTVQLEKVSQRPAEVVFCTRRLGIKT